MIYIFAPSYQTILFSLHQFSLDEITYVTYNPSVKEFAEQAGIAVIYREEQTDLSVQGYKDHRQYCLNMIKDWEGRDILFCFYTFDIWSLYQLTELRKKNKVYFYNTDNLTAPGFDESKSSHLPVINNSLSGLLNKDYRRVLTRQKLFYYITGQHMDILRFEKNFLALGIALKKCRKMFLPFKKKENENIFVINQRSILEKISLTAPDILFIDSGEPSIKYPAGVLEAIELAVKNTGLQLIVKPHPTFPPPPDLKAHPAINKFIPVELFNGIPRLVIGIGSYALIFFSSNHLTISLINLVTFDLPEIKERIKKEILADNSIITPETEEELKTIISSLSKQK